MANLTDQSQNVAKHIDAFLNPLTEKDPFPWLTHIRLGCVQTKLGPTGPPPICVPCGPVQPLLPFTGGDNVEIFIHHPTACVKCDAFIIGMVVKGAARSFHRPCVQEHRPRSVSPFPYRNLIC